MYDHGRIVIETGPAPVWTLREVLATSDGIRHDGGMADSLQAGSVRVGAADRTLVAERLVATPGHREYGYLTLQTALFAGTRLLFEVKPGSFRPPPQVDSAVVLLTPHTLDLGVRDREAFLRFLGHCFRQKRKTLRNNLAGVYGKDVIDPWPEAGLRAEQLTLEQFAGMFHRLGPE